MSYRDSKYVDSKVLQACDPIQEEKIADPFCMIIAGGAGDLSKRKLLPTLYHLYSENKLPEKFSVIGFGVPDLKNDEYRTLISESIQKYSKEIYEKNKVVKFINHFEYVGGDFEKNGSYEELKEKILNKKKNLETDRFSTIYYMAVPPLFFPKIIKQIGDHELNNDCYNPRIIIEKPFGHDLESAEELNRIMIDVFKENQIYRMDHYLGKETVQNIIFFRFSNSIYEPLWNRRYIDNVQITVAEEIGIEHRGKFYEHASVIRDIIQNHMLQLIALIAMEPPVGFEADLIRNEKVKIFESIRIMDDEDIDSFTVRGQYGMGNINNRQVVEYRKEKDVAVSSDTPTFFAAKFYIDNWRWANVPFYVRAGKRMKKRLTEIVIQFKQPPLRLFGRDCDIIDPSYLILKIQPEESIKLRYNVKQPNTPNRIKQVNMKFSYDEEFHAKTFPAYSRLLLDCVKGDLTLFVRQDGIRAMWSLIDPITKRWESTKPPEFPNYAAGSWGPQESNNLLMKDGHFWISNQE